MSAIVDIIAGRLHEAGCRHAFGIPGGEVLAIMDALQRAGIAFTLVRHENAGGFMAEGTYHATGAPGILLATIGPGVANGLNVVINALQDQVPLIVLSGCVDEAEAHSYTHQVFDHQAVMRPLTKATFKIVAGAAATILEKAVAIALADPPGPVHLDIPIGLATADEPDVRPYRPARPSPMTPAGPALALARRRLAAAERPIMLAGVGALLHKAAPLVEEVAQRFSMPVLTTYKAKGVLPETHPLALGAHGLSPLSDRHVLPLLAQADLVLSVGYDPIEMRDGWRYPFDAAKHLELVHLENRHGMHGSALSFVGDVRESLLALSEGLSPERPVWPGGEPAAVRARLSTVFGDRPEWGAHQAFATLRRAAPAGTILTIDSGAHRILLSQMWQAAGGERVLQSTALCTMGCAVPLAMGYKCAKPEAPVVAVVGDAGAEMALGELATLRDMGLPLVIVIMVDRQLGLIEIKQRRTGYQTLGVDLGLTDWPVIARGFGAQGVWIEDAATFEAELVRAFAGGGPTILACLIGSRAYEGAF